MIERRIDVAGVGLHVREFPSEGEAIVFLHHGGGNLMMWEPVVPHLADTYRCITLDLRGHGRSDAPASGYTIDAMANDVIGVLEVLGLHRAHIVGSSLGAEVGLCLAADHPDRVRSLICEGAYESPYGPYSASRMTSADAAAEIAERMEALAARSEPVFESIEAFVAQTQERFESWGLWNEALRSETVHNAHILEDGQVVHAWRKWAKDGYMAHFFGLRFEELYPRVTCPMLVLPGEHDANDLETSRAMQALCALAPSCRIHVVPGAIHPFGWMILPEAMAAAVQAFLSETSGAED